MSRRRKLYKGDIINVCLFFGYTLVFFLLTFFYPLLAVISILFCPLIPVWLRGGFSFYGRWLQLPYYDVWETQHRYIIPAYAEYYTYVWTSWHELEQRVLLILSFRCLLLGF